MLQAAMFNGLSLDPFSAFNDCRSPTEVGVCGRHIVQALVVALVIVVFYERFDPGLKITGQEVIFQ